MVRRRRCSYLFSRYLLIYQLLLPHTSHSHHIPLGNCFGDILIPIIIIHPLITMATNEEMLVTAFHEKVPIRFLLIWQICSAIAANELINFF